MASSNPEFVDGLPQHFREVLEFRLSLDLETDRGCALMVASFLDYKLEELLAAKLVDNRSVVEEFFKHNGPFGSFSARIDAAYLLGLIGDNTRRDLHLIRKIRNDFGHSHQVKTFTDSSITSRCNELFLTVSPIPTKEPRRRYTKSAMAILALMSGNLSKIQHIPVGKDLAQTREELEKYLTEVIEDAPFESHPEKFKAEWKQLELDVIRKALE